MKDIEKYIGYYLGVYVVVLAICGFFQYFYYCQGQSLMCAFNLHRINSIITTTAYVLTPIVAIIGFQSWKTQQNFKTAKELLNDSLPYLYRFQRELDIICKCFENIFNRYTLHEYLISPTLMARDLKITDEHLESFNNYIEQLSYFKTVKGLDENVKKYTKLSNEMLIINKYLKDNLYKKSYPLITFSDSSTWYDRSIDLCYQRESHEFKEIDYWFETITSKMLNIYEFEDDNGEKQLITYQNLTEKIKKLYDQINIIIAAEIKA